MADHKVIVAKVAGRVKQQYEKKIPFRVYHGSTNGTHASQRNADNSVDIRSLKRVLNVDVDTKLAVVEPNVPMDVLVEATLQKGLIPKVVMEFPGITAGGGFCGTGGESSSFRYGFFESTVERIEIVIPSGEIMEASKTVRPDLFWGAASAFGTLGIVTLLEVSLIEAAPYVALLYKHFTNAGDTIRYMQTAQEDPTVDYLDGIIYSPDSYVIVEGRLVQTIPDKSTAPVTFQGGRDPWFYLHMDRQRHHLPQKDQSQNLDYIPIRDYLFRYDRGGFWMGRYAFSYFLTPFNRITRYLLDPFMHTRVMYRAMHKSGMIKDYLVQDVAIPPQHLEQFLSWVHREYKILPLWLCPLHVARKSPNSSHGLLSSISTPDAPPLINVGIWGPLPGGSAQAIAQNRKLEHKVHSLGGKKWLYAQTYTTQEEFEAAYDLRSYNELREKYHASHLPSVYDKVTVDFRREIEKGNESFVQRVKRGFWSIWPLRGLYGVYYAMFKEEYLLQPSIGTGKVRKSE